ncbi:hypothetical protein EDC01DRAFT_779944 [Geopyxis carbonaria]|nr:hypothetical protein EDC01DRAFT_779944 [Geopyxis carbonaria]
MTQAPLKSKPLTAKSKNKPKRSTGVTKWGSRTIAPKKGILKKTNTFQKKLSAQLTAATEKRLAERVGHLEMLPGGKRDNGAPKKDNGAPKKNK